MRPAPETSCGRHTIYLLRPKEAAGQDKTLRRPSIELIGQAPRVDNVTCKKNGEEEKRLLFDFKERK
jgi:hypothetical protein